MGHFADPVFLCRMNEGPLELLTENSMRVEEVEELLLDSVHNGFPVVESLTSRHLVGFVSRSDLVKSLGMLLPLPPILELRLAVHALQLVKCARGIDRQMSLGTYSAFREYWISI